MDWSIKSYDQLTDLYKELVLKYCKECCMTTLHIRRSFEEYNQRKSCLKCEEREDEERV